MDFFVVLIVFEILGDFKGFYIFPKYNPICFYVLGRFWGSRYWEFRENQKELISGIYFMDFLFRFWES